MLGFLNFNLLKHVGPDSDFIHAGVDLCTNSLQYSVSIPNLEQCVEQTGQIKMN